MTITTQPSSTAYDELLAKIDESKRMACWVLDEPQGCSQCLACIAYNALRAVVELHKPVTAKDGLILCSANCEGEYPCPTIQAIEKELG